MLERQAMDAQRLGFAHEPGEFPKFGNPYRHDAKIPPASSSEYARLGRIVSSMRCSSGRSCPNRIPVAAVQAVAAPVQVLPQPQQAQPTHADPDHDLLALLERVRPMQQPVIAGARRDLVDIEGL
jgi:hypothetical protein